MLDNPRGFFKDDAYAAAQLKELAKSDQSTNAIDASTYASERRFSRILFAQHRVWPIFHRYLKHLLVTMQFEVRSVFKMMNSVFKNDDFMYSQWWILYSKWWKTMKNDAGVARVWRGTAAHSDIRFFASYGHAWYELCISNNGFCISNDEFCISNDEFWIGPVLVKVNFVFKMMNYALTMMNLY